MKNINICIAGIGNIGSQVIKSIQDNNTFVNFKANLNINIIGISSKDKFKKRIIDINDYNWLENSLDLLNIKGCDILIELIGQEKGLSYKLVKKALEKKINVITANKALLSKHGNELFEIADKNKVLLLFEASVAGGIPVIKIIRQSVFLNKIKRIYGILNGTTNYILSEMENSKLSFNEVLKKAQNNGFAESDPTNDIEGIDSVHKLSLLSALCFGVKINFNNSFYKGISNIDIEDIIYAKKLGYRIKLISQSEIKNNQIISVTEPMLIDCKSEIANVNGVMNAIKLETDYLKSLFLVGEGAGGVATTSSILSDILEISNSHDQKSLGYENSSLIQLESADYNNTISSFYLRIIVKDISGVLAKITSNLTNEGISIETILQLPENNHDKDKVPIIITTHGTTISLLNKAIVKIENLDFVISKITVINIDKNI